MHSLAGRRGRHHANICRQCATVCVFVLGFLRCAFAQRIEPSVVNPLEFGASGSAAVATCDFDGDQTFTQCSGLEDFRLGQNVIVRNAGPPVTLAPPVRIRIVSRCAGPGCNPNGSTEYRYRIASIDSNGAVSTASTPFGIETGHDELVAGSRSHYNELVWTAVPGARGYAIYKRIRGTFQLIDLVTNVTYRDYGALVRDNSGMPTQAPDRPVPTDVLATITRIHAQSVSLFTSKGDPGLGTARQRASLLHDDTAAIQAAFTSIPRTGGTVWIPAGTFNIHANTNHSFARNVGLYIVQDHFTLIGAGSSTVLRLDSGSFSNTALLGSSAIAIDGRAKASQSGIDDGRYQYGCYRAGEGFEPADSTVNCKLPEYNILRPIPRGATTVTVDGTARTAIAAGDDVFIRTGSISGSGKPDAEINQVKQILPDGMIALRWPTAKPYQRECHITGSTGATSVDCSGNKVPSPFTIANVTTATLHKISLHNLTFDGLDGPNWFSMPAQIIGFDVSGLIVHAGDMFASGGNRFEHVYNNKITVSYLDAEVIPTDAGGTDCVVEQNTIVGIRPMNIQITEGAANVTWRDNLIQGPAQVGFDQTGNIGQLFSGNGRCYRVSLIGNRLTNTSGNQFVKLGSADQLVPGERSCLDGVVEDNIMEGDSGAAYRNSGAAKVRAGDLYGNGWVVQGNVMNGAHANFDIHSGKSGATP